MLIMKAFMTTKESAGSEKLSFCDKKDFSKNYLKYFKRRGVEINVISSRNENIELCMDRCELLILPGGGDVPNEYMDSDSKHEEQKQRDIFEKKLIELARQRNIPIIGICRGFQFLNGYYGGKVSYLSDQEHVQQNYHDVTLHDGRKINVNSSHKCGVYRKNLSSKFQGIAMREEDECMEAYYSDELNILAFQWHPERPLKFRARCVTDRLIREFLKKQKHVK